MAQLTFTVSDSDTARALGSGDLEVLGTPRLLAWLEAATVAELEPGLRPGETSVGTRVELEHLAAARVGAVVVVTADVAHTDGRLRRLTAAAQDAGGRLLATAAITRVVVDRARFLAGVPG